MLRQPPTLNGSWQTITCRISTHTRPWLGVLSTTPAASVCDGIEGRLDYVAMPPDELLTTIADLARDKLGFRGDLRPEMRLVEDLELDSIRLLTLATEIEDHFRICLDEDDEASIETVADLVAVVERKLAG